MRPLYQDQFTDNPLVLLWHYIRYLLGLKPPPMYMVTVARKDVAFRLHYNTDYHLPMRNIKEWLNEQDSEYRIWQVPYSPDIEAVIKIQFRNQDTAALYKLTHDTMPEDPSINHLLKPTKYKTYIN